MALGSSLPLEGTMATLRKANMLSRDTRTSDKMVVYCCAYNCNELFKKGGQITFHSFPKDPERRKLWEVKIKRVNFKATDSSKICSKHFSSDCFDTTKFGGTWLKPDAFPSIFDFGENSKGVTTRKPPTKTAISPDESLHEGIFTKYVEIMVASCCAYGCNARYNKPENVSFHAFPKDPYRRRIWALNLGRKNYTPNIHSRICSRHFTEDCFDKAKFGGRWLKNDATPTIFDSPHRFQIIERKLSCEQLPLYKERSPSTEFEEISKPILLSEETQSLEDQNKSIFLDERMSCAAYGCSNRDSKKVPGITFHKFPVSDELRHRWMAAVRRQDFTPTPRSRLCSVHFSEDCMDRTSTMVVKLKKNAVPTIFPGFPKHLQEKLKQESETSEHLPLQTPVPADVYIASLTGTTASPKLTLMTDNTVSECPTMFNNPIDISPNSTTGKTSFSVPLVSSTTPLVSLKTTPISLAAAFIPTSAVSICSDVTVPEQCVDSPEKQYFSDTIHYSHIFYKASFERKLKSFKEKNDICKRKIKHLSQKRRRLNNQAKQLYSEIVGLKESGALRKADRKLFERMAIQRNVN